MTAREKSEAKDKLDAALRKIKEGIPIGNAPETVADTLWSPTRISPARRL